MDSLLRFGQFELDLRNSELRRQGTPVRMPPQPFKVLTLLVRNAGHVVSREEIRNQIWAQDTFVDFEQGLNYCIKQIRSALADDAASPRYIETRQRLGYRFIAPVEGSSGLPAPAIAGRLMLAVLPFQNLSGDEKQEYFSDGLTEEMTTELSRLNPERLGVIARTSAMKYKRADKTIDEIGRELGVHYVLEGSVRRSGNRVRIAAQLIQVSDQTHVYANSVDRDVGDILVLQSEVAHAIAGEIRLKLSPQQQARLAAARSVDAAAHEAYLKGRYFWNKRTKHALHKSVTYFEKAIEGDPLYAVAYAGLADCYLRLMDYNHLRPIEAFVEARAAGEKALQLDDTLAEAHTSLGHLGLHEFEWTVAERGLTRAIALNPNYGTAHYFYGNFLAAMRRFDEAILEVQRTLELDPVSPSTGVNAAFIFYLAGRYDEAIDQAENVLEIDPNFADHPHYNMGLAYEAQGYCDRAIAAFRQAPLLGHSAGARPALAHALALAGERGEAIKLLNELETMAGTRYVSPYDFALIFLGLGDIDRACASLEEAYEQHASALVFLQADPRLDVLRGNSRFVDLSRRMNFPA